MATSTPVQLYTNAETCVDDMLEGVCETNTALHLFKTHRILVDKRWLHSRKNKKNRVAILSGGGSGHEPFSAGYIGVGMLSGCVAGDVFTSPPSTDITAVIKTLAKNNEAGVLVIVFNYTGDRLNFGLAVEKCKAAGIKVETHISGDDTALTEVEGTAGRRGLCGTLFTIKIAGAMSERGYTLQQILNTCKELGQNTGTIGMSVSSCTLPGATHPLMNIQQGYMELGLGVHGEPGAACVKLGTLEDTVEVMLTHLSDPTHTSTHLHLPPHACVCVMINNLGGLTELELSNITFQVVKELRKRNIKIVRIYKGSLMTSLDMRGTHISILRIPGSEDSGSVDSVDSHPWIGLLDAPTTAPSWPTPYLWGGGEVEEEELGVDISTSSMSTVFEAEPNEYTLNFDHSQILRSCLEAVVESMKKSEYLLNELDGVCGDGDCGSTIVKGVYGLAQHIDKLPITKPNSVLKILSEISSKNMGGTSGALYSILLTTAATTLTTTTTTTTTGEANHRVRWSKALRAGTDAVTKYGGASVGDRTMLDALIPAIEVLESAPEHTDVHTLLRQMAEAADIGTKKTANMKPREGIMAARGVILSIIFLVSLASCGVEAKQHVPVLVWNNNQASDGVPAVSALQYINYNTFQSKYLHAFQPKNILLFIQDALSIEDLSSHAGEFQHVNRLMQEGHSLYLPNVEDAAHLAHDLPTHGYSVEVLEPGIPVAGLNLKQQDDNLIVVKLPSTLTNPSRKRALQKADEVIVNVISKIGEQREFTVIFTGLKPSVENKGEEQYEERIRVSRSLQQSKPEYPVGFHYSKCVYIYFFNDMVLNFYQGNDTRSEKKLIYSVAINESLAMDEGELTGDCTQKHQSITLKYNNVVINNHTHSQLDLHYHFQLVGDEWSFTYVHTILTPGSTDTVDFKPQNSDITGIPIRMSYSCSQKITLRSNNTDPETNSYYTLVLNGVQMQPRTENFPAIKFSGAWDCVGFFTVPILSSVFVTFLLLVILSVGMFMLSDIKTMDRFDDPKRPAILVPTAGTD